LKGTAAQVEETAVAAREIGEAMRHLTQHINRSAIVTSERVGEATTKVKSSSLASFYNCCLVPNNLDIRISS
jgi:hypothetical protein